MRMRFVLALAGLVAATPVAAADLDFVLTNGTGKPIKAIQLSVAGAADFKDDVLQPESLEPGKRSSVTFPQVEAKCSYDVKATFGNDTTEVWSNVNFCDDAFITLKYDAKGAPAYIGN